MDQQGLAGLLDTVFGRWRSQIIYVGVKVGIFDFLGDKSADGVQISTALKLNTEKGERLLDALASLSLLQKDGDKYSLTQVAQFLRAEHKPSIRSLVLFEEGPSHYEAWKHLETVIRGHAATGYESAFGKNVWEYLKANNEYANLFQEAMSSYSSTETAAIVETLDLSNLTAGEVICDVGGGDGHLLQAVISRYTKAKGILFDLPETIGTAQDRSNSQSGDRLERIGGDMFEGVPDADIYFLKHILHDWNDQECLEILSSIKRNARPNARLVVCEFVVPDEPTPSFSSLIDIHMMCVSTGRQRKFSELKRLVQSVGWSRVELVDLPGTPLQLVDCR